MRVAKYLDNKNALMRCEYMLGTCLGMLDYCPETKVKALEKSVKHWQKKRAKLGEQNQKLWADILSQLRR